MKDGLAAEALIAKYEMATRTAMNQDAVLAGMAAFVMAGSSIVRRSRRLAIKASIKANADARLLEEWAGTDDDFDD